MPTHIEDADAPVLDWMARADTEPGYAKAPQSKKASREDEDRERGSHTVDVQFDGTGWCVRDSSLDKPLKFDHLDDAEARASELSKDTGHSVAVRGADGALIAAYGETNGK